MPEQGRRSAFKNARDLEGQNPVATYSLIIIIAAAAIYFR